MLLGQHVKGYRASMEYLLQCLMLSVLTEKRGVSVERFFCGHFSTSQEMAGVSITVLHLNDVIRKALGELHSRLRFHFFKMQNVYILR